MCFVLDALNFRMWAQIENSHALDMELDATIVNNYKKYDMSGYYRQ